MRRKNTVAKIKKRAATFAGNGEALQQTETDPKSRDGKPQKARAPPDDFDLLTVDEVAAILRCSVSSLNKWRLENERGPRFIYVGRRVRYRRADLAEFITESTRRSTSDQGGRKPIAVA
jgi:excisionase family DNA binding protein